MNNKGFTLIELLITMTILSALIFTGSYSYQLLANRWQKEIGSYSETLEVTKGVKLLHRVLKGISPYIITDIKKSPIQPGFLFIGGKERLLGVTETGIFSGKYSEVFRLSLEPKKNGLYDLVYQSTSLQSEPILTAQQTIDFTHSHVLLENVQALSFSYKGWESLPLMPLQKEQGQEAGVSDAFSGIDRQLMPIELSVNLKLNDETLEFSLNIERDALQHISLYLQEG